MTNVSQLLTAINSPVSYMPRSGIPLLNTLTQSFQNVWADYGQVRWKKHLYAWYNITPELTAFINKISSDVTSGWKFKPIKPGDTSRNKILKANSFAQQIVLGQAIDEIFTDILLTGEGFGWLGFVNKQRVKEIIDNHNSMIEFKAKELVKAHEELSVKEKVQLYGELISEFKQIEGISDITKIDEDILKPRKFRSIASTTMEVIHDQQDVKMYKQVVGTNIQIFNPEEVIRYTLMRRDGKVTGFTPVSSIIVQLELLRSMWQNQLSLHKNGGNPDKIFAIENMNPNNPAFKRIEQEIATYHKPENRHRNMLWTGKVTVHELEQLDKMQFMDVGLYVIGVLAMQWQIPRSSIPMIVGGTNTKDDTGGNSERGYWQAIKKFQDTFAETMNTQLWIPHFGVKISFDNPYLQLDVQRETALMNKLNNVMTMDNILMKSGKQLNLDTRLNMLDISEEDLEDSQQEEMMNGSAEGIGTSAQLGNRANDSTDKSVRKTAKRQEQYNVAASRGVSTGTGKEKKELSDQIVPMDVFVQLYQEDRAYHPGQPPRIFKSIGKT